MVPGSFFFLTTIEFVLFVYFTWSYCVRLKYLGGIKDLSYSFKFIPRPVADITLFPWFMYTVGNINRAVFGVKNNDPSFAIASTLAGNFFWLTFIVGVSIIYCDGKNTFHKEFMWTHMTFLLMGVFIIFFSLMNKSVGYNDVALLIVTYILMIAYTWTRHYWVSQKDHPETLQLKKKYEFYERKNQEFAKELDQK